MSLSQEMETPILPLVSLPQTLQKYLHPYRTVFCRTAGFSQVSRYLTGLSLSPNKTLQGIHAQWVWHVGEAVGRRAMPAAVFESAGWDGETLMQRHRQVVALVHRDHGRAVLSLDWTFAHHPYSEKIYGAKAAYDYVNYCWSCY